MTLPTWFHTLIVGALALSASAAPGEAGAAPCARAIEGEGQTLPQIRPIAKGVWWVSAERGDANADNRGQVSNLLIVREEGRARQRLWLVGSGPSPMWALRLQCQISIVLGTPVTDVISPWPHPELVLGARSFHARHWAHEEVARGMQRECRGCVLRLRQRMGTAQTDLGSEPVDIPRRLLRGDQGRLGPFQWHRLKRAKNTPVTLWHLPTAGLLTAHGLVWAGAVPDLRDTRVDELLGGLQGLQKLLARLPGSTRVLGEQGPLASPQEVGLQAAYLRALQHQVLLEQARGDDGVSTPTTMDGFAADQALRLRDPQHSLNWQRAWRHAEETMTTVQRR